MLSLDQQRATPPHRLHGPERAWPETNCYVDLWIELLSHLGRDPMPLLGLAAAMDWEGDHFTFLKPAAGDLFAAAGVTLHELAMWDEVEAHVTAQLAAGAIPILEVDAFFLPDTRANAYRDRHTKTTIAISAIDPACPQLDYFHNAGHFTLQGDDYAGVLGRPPYQPLLFPYAELARVASPAPELAAAREHARRTLQQHARTRSPGNPVSRFAEALPTLLARAGTDPARINALCFNTTRQFGGGFGLLADHLAWLGQDPTDAACLADSAKSLQFQIARSARRARTGPEIPAALDAMAVTWARCMARIEAAAPPVSLNRAAA